MKKGYVYIMSSYSKVLYIGITSNLTKRIWEHKHKIIKGFTNKYNVNKLVYYEEFDSIISAINREKELKGWLRVKKIELISINNPVFTDLASDWF